MSAEFLTVQETICVGRVETCIGSPPLGTDWLSSEIDRAIARLTGKVYRSLDRNYQVVHRATQIAPFISNGIQYLLVLIEFTIGPTDVNSRSRVTE